MSNDVTIRITKTKPAWRIGDVVKISWSGKSRMVSRAWEDDFGFHMNLVKMSKWKIVNVIVLIYYKVIDFFRRNLKSK